ncbi:hypothetical protein ACIQW5_27570 [Methylorubrum thiocyanatum]|jgi:hypothetical protein|nr:MULTISPECIES: hypothetical protein [Methylorubrum]MBB5765322.1 hypothetical protein [Methylorubrum rhodesianum]
MAFAVQWTSSLGTVSLAQATAQGAYRQAERVTMLGMKNVRIRLPNGELVTLADFQEAFAPPRSKGASGMNNFGGSVS